MKTRVLILSIFFSFSLSSCSWKKIQHELNEIIEKKSPDKGIAISYPFDGTIMPPELFSPTFEWNDSSNFTNIWYVFLVNDAGKILIKDKVSETKWRPDSVKWIEFKKENISQKCNFFILGKDKNKNTDNTNWAHISFQISKDSVEADIFFRAVTIPFSYAVKNVHTIEWYIGNIGGEKPRKLLDNMPVCANCHSFSAQKPVLAMDVDYGNDKGSYTISEINDTCKLKTSDIISWSNFKKDENGPTFGLLSQISPDGNHVLSTVKDLSVFVAVDNNPTYSQLFFPIKGIIGIYDCVNKSFSELNGANDPKLVQSNPVWSPDGNEILFTRTQAYVSERVANAGRALLHPKDVEEFTSGKKSFKYDIYSLDFNEGKGSEPKALKGASNNGKSNYFPKYSPDGKWVVFCQADNFMLLQPDSKLYIVPSEGGEARLMNCNLDHMNSWHSWSPNGKWLVFSSKQKGKYTQLYLTHIDENGNDSPPVLLENLICEERAANIPEFYPHKSSSFKKIKDDFSHTASYYSLIAADQMENKYYRRAWGNLEKAITTDSTFLEAYFKRITLNALLRQAGSKVDRKDKIAAQNIVNKLLAENKGNEQLNLLKATLLSNLGEYDKALELAKGNIKANPKSIKSYELIASIHRKNKSYELAIPIYNQLLQLKPNSNLVLKSQIAEAYKETKRYDQSLNLINSLIGKYPGDESLRMMRVKISMDLNDLPKAKNDLDWLIEKDNTNYRYYQLYAQYNIITKDIQGFNFNTGKVVSILNTEIAKNPENIELYFDRASTYLSLKKLDESLNDYNFILSTFPINYEALKQLAKIKLMKQSWAEAIAVYKKLNDNYQAEEEFFNNSGLAYIQLKDYNSAKNSFEKAISLNPENVDSRYNKARLNKMMGELQKSNEEIASIKQILEKKQKQGKLTENDKEILNSIK